MLILLFGPSGVGKTAVIDELVQTCGWKAIASYVTRPARLNEVHKISVPESQYCAWLQSDMMFTHVSQLGGMYGTMRKDIDTAVESREPFVLDFALEDYQRFFSGVPNKPFVILPESLEQLKSQLEAANRYERIGSAALDLARFTKDRLAHELKNEHEIVVNRRNRLQDTIDQLVSRVILY
jgi:guanylate kinase